MFTIFSTKGGSGKTVIATNLAVSFARDGKRTLLIDFDLHSGDDALVLGLSPRWTVLDLVQSPGDLDAEKLAGFVTRHSSGVDLLPAPTRPDEEELVAIDRLEPLLEVARESYDVVVIDTSSQFAPATLLAIDNTDTLVLVGASDVPTIKSLKIALETLELLEVNQLDVRILMNRSGAKVGLEDRDVERTLPPRNHLHIAVRQSGAGFGQPRPAGDPRQSAVSRCPIAPGDGTISGGRGREQTVKPDRERTLGGRMRRIEPATPGGEQGAQKDEHDPFAEIKALAQAEAVRELGTALNEGEVVEEELHEQVQRADRRGAGRSRHPAFDP